MTHYRHHAYDLWMRRQRRQVNSRAASGLRWGMALGRLVSVAKTAAILTAGLVLVALGWSMR